MTMFEPTLTVRRLLVRRGEAAAYDEIFHDGINVIRGDNSSGKSTILNFIFFALGGDLARNDWSDHALLCDHVWLEVELNGQPAVLRREVDASIRSPMGIYGGRLDEALQAPADRWSNYPYQRGHKESFSQALFRLLGMPDVAVEGTSSITFHQILRLLYADQLSPAENLFRYEGYDSDNLREAVGNMLCGAFDTRIYELQQEKRSTEKLYVKTASDLRSIFSVIGGDESLTVQWVQEKRKNLLSEREALLEKVAVEEEQYYEQEAGRKISLKSQNALYQKVRNLQHQLTEQRALIDRLELDVSDSDAFINTLNRRLEALKDGRVAASLVGTIYFGICPSCYAETLEEDEESAACHLCKTPLDSERARDRVVGIINDLSIQIGQSELLQEGRKKRLGEQQEKHAKILKEWRESSRELTRLTATPTSEGREKLRELHRDLGYLDKSVDDTERQLAIANRIGDLSGRKAELDQKIQDLDAQIESMKRSQTNRLLEARSEIEKETIELLKADLPRQDSFDNPQRVDFSFAKNSIGVDGHTYFSASSRVVLKTAVLVGFLAAALKNPKFRHPRFVMIDITEDKGMERERSHNFQEQVLRLSEGTTTQHQLILATAMPSPNLGEEAFVGKFSTKANGTLAIRT